MKIEAKLRKCGRDLHEVIIYKDGIASMFAGNADESAEKAVSSAIAIMAKRVEEAQQKLIRAQAEAQEMRMIYEEVKKIPYQGKVESVAPKGWDKVEA